MELTCVGSGPLHVRPAGPAPVAASQPEGQPPAAVGLLLPSGTHPVGTGEMRPRLAGVICTISRPVKSSDCGFELMSMAENVPSLNVVPSFIVVPSVIVVPSLNVVPSPIVVPGPSCDQAGVIGKPLLLIALGRVACTMHAMPNAKCRISTYTFLHHLATLHVSLKY